MIRQSEHLQQQLTREQEAANRRTREMEEENRCLHQQVSSFMSDVVSVSIIISLFLTDTSTGQTAGGGEGTLTAESRPSTAEDQGDG